MSTKSAELVLRCFFLFTSRVYENCVMIIIKNNLRRQSMGDLVCVCLRKDADGLSDGLMAYGALSSIVARLGGFFLLGSIFSRFGGRCSSSGSGGGSRLGLRDKALSAIHAEELVTTRHKSSHHLALATHNALALERSSRARAAAAGRSGR